MSNLFGGTFIAPTSLSGPRLPAPVLPITPTVSTVTNTYLPHVGPRLLSSTAGYNPTMQLNFTNPFRSSIEMQAHTHEPRHDLINFSDNYGTGARAYTPEVSPLPMTPMTPCTFQAPIEHNIGYNVNTESPADTWLRGTMDNTKSVSFNVQSEGLRTSTPNNIRVSEQQTFKPDSDTHFYSNNAVNMPVNCGSLIENPVDMDCYVNPTFEEQGKKCMSGSNNTGSCPTYSQVRRKEKSPQTFDGKHSFQDFLIQFEHISNWNGWDNLEKAQQLIMCLRGPAQRILSELTAGQMSSYTTVKNALLRRFDPPGRESAYKSEFRNRTRGEGESLVDYGERLRVLARKAYPHKETSQLESDTIDQFVDGVRNFELGNHVQFRHPVTLDQAVSAAIEFEAVSNRHTQGRKPMELNPEAPAFVHAVASAGSKTDTIDKDLATLILEQFEQLNKKLSSQHKGSSKNYVPLAQRKCYSCGETGHMSYTCPKKSNVNNSGKENQGN